MNPYIEIIIRTLSVYIFIVFAIRIFGKKELAQLSVIDLVFILLISNSVQNAMVGPDSSLFGGLVAAASLFGINFLLKRVLYRNGRIGRLLQGEPIMLIHKGEIIPGHLERVEITVGELEAAIREHGVEKISDVDLAVLEVDGNISVLSNNYQHKSVRRRKVHKAITKTID
jgi:uncharacterized membrane protein YcaP (DUF421 family)